jgi:hypothetical protein
MDVQATAPLAAAIRDHLDLKRRNSVLEYEMPLVNYLDSSLANSHEPLPDHLPPDEAITEEVATVYPPST